MNHSGIERRQIRLARLKIHAIALLLLVLAAGYSIGYLQTRLDTSTPNEETPIGYVGFEPAEIDLGAQLWGTTIPVHARFVNHGATPVEIRSARSSCGCAVIQGDGHVGQIVQPGASYRIEMNLKTLTIPGPKHRRLDVKLASGEEHTLAIVVTVEGTWRLSRDFVDFGEVVLEAEDGPVARSVVFESQ